MNTFARVAKLTTTRLLIFGSDTILTPRGLEISVGQGYETLPLVTQPRPTGELP
jgi:hypothetical protein